MKQIKKLKNLLLNLLIRVIKNFLIITGKGLRSKSYDNPYVSEKLSVLKYSVPEYIKNDENLTNKISKISQSRP